MRATRALVCLALVAAACGANPQSPRTGSGDKLYEAGVGYQEESGTSLYFNDPDGARVELIADPLGNMYGHEVG